MLLLHILTGSDPFFKPSIVFRRAVKAFLEARYDVPDDLSEPCRDLLSRLMAADPEQRMSLAEAADHPWVQDDKPGAAPAKTLPGQGSTLPPPPTLPEAGELLSQDVRLQALIETWGPLESLLLEEIAQRMLPPAQDTEVIKAIFRELPQAKPISDSEW